MAYFVDSEKRMTDELSKVIEKHFSGLAQVAEKDYHTIVVQVDSGFPSITHSLSQAELDAGVCGGGIIQALDGRCFEILIREV